MIKLRTHARKSPELNSAACYGFILEWCSYSWYSARVFWVQRTCCGLWGFIQQKMHLNMGVYLLFRKDLILSVPISTLVALDA